MLVLTSMFISVVEGLPKTSYMKMVEVWLIFNLLIPFSDVLLHTYTDHVRWIKPLLVETNWCLRSAIDEAREVNHHGMVVKVGQDSDDEKEPWQYNKDLVSKDEKTQDAALRRVLTCFSFMLTWCFPGHIMRTWRRTPTWRRGSTCATQLATKLCHPLPSGLPYPTGLLAIKA